VKAINLCSKSHSDTDACDFIWIFFWHILQLLSCDSYASYIRSAIAMARCLFVAKFCRFSIETAEYRLSWISTQSCAHIGIRISPELREITYGIVPNSDFSWFSSLSSRHVNRRKCCQGMFNVRWNMMDSYTLVYMHGHIEKEMTLCETAWSAVSLKSPSDATAAEHLLIFFLSVF